MRKLLSLVLVLSLVLGSFSFAFAAPADVEGTDCEDAVARLTALEIISGFPDGTYRPNETVTRAQFAKIMVTALGVGKAAEYAAGETKFTDVPATHWASGYINVATDMGIINGYGNGMFGPEDKVTYAQAITMIMRGLGYEPKATALGGYPGGYLAVAAEKGITDDINVVGSLAANRGDVAVMVNAALDVPLMVQKTWGQYPEYEEDESKTLLSEKLDVEEISGRVVDIARLNDNLEDNEIVIRTDEFTGDQEDTTYTVLTDVDYEYIMGAEVTALVDGDEIVSLVVDSDMFFDAVEVNADADEVTLVDADKDYDIADTYYVIENDSQEGENDTLEAEETFSYAKVVLDDDGDVVFVYAFNWDDYFVVEKVDDEVVYNYGEELEVEDYTIVKDGKTISIDDIEEGDIFFFEEGIEYAEVYNKSVEGEIESVFVDAFEIDGEDYTIAGEYLDDDELVALDSDALETMQDEGDVTVYFDRAGNVVFVDGELGEEETSSFYAYVIEDTTPYSDREDTYWTLDVVNENGEQVDYDILEADTEDADFYTGDAGWSDDIDPGAIVEITVDEDGEVEAVELVSVTTNTTEDATIEVGDDYFEGYKLNDSVVVFDVSGYDDTADYDDDDNYIEVSTFGELEYDEILDADVYANTDDVVKVLVVAESDEEEDTTDYAGIITDVKDYSDSDVCKLTLLVNGEENVYYTEDDETVHDAVYELAEGTVIEFTFDNNSEEIIGATEVTDVDANDDMVEGVAVDSISIGDKEIVVGSDTYDLSDAILYDATDTSDIEEISIRDLDEGDTVTLYLYDDGSRFVKYLLLTEEAAE